MKENKKEAEKVVVENTKEATTNETEEVKEDKSDKTLEALQAVDQANIGEHNENETTESNEKRLETVFSELPSYDSDKTCEEEVELLRNQFKQAVVGSSRLSKWLTIGVVVFLIVALICMFFVPTDLKWISYTLLGIGLVGFVVVMILSKKEQKNVGMDVTNYVQQCITKVDSYIFTRDEFTSTTYSTKARMDLEDLTQAHYFDTINDFNSRNVVKTTYNGKELKVGEIACRNPYQVPADNLDHSKDNPKKLPSFSYGIFGKYITYPITLAEDASVIVLLKGTNAYLPTFLDGYVELKNIPDLDENYLVWADNNVVGTALFTSEIVDLLNSFKSDESLENIFFSINHNGLKFCLNYNEGVMEVPTQVAVKGTPYQHYYNDLTKVLKFIDLVEGK
jgi:hypothetical protein